MPAVSAIRPRLKSATPDVSSDPLPPYVLDAYCGSVYTGNDFNNGIYGSSCNNKIDGRGGKDLLYGMGGDDILIGGAGQDHLWGGEGNDTFVFNSRSESPSGVHSRDAIFDFAAGDRIDVSGIDPVIRLYGDQAFKLVTDFTGQPGELRWDVWAPVAFIVSGDVDGDGVGDFEVEVHHAASLTSLNADNFIL